MRTLKLILSGWQSVGLVVFIMLFFNMEVSGKGKITKMLLSLRNLFIRGRMLFIKTIL